MSPIRNENGMLCRKIRRRSRSITQFNHTRDMSVNIEENLDLHNDDLLGECNGSFSFYTHHIYHIYVMLNIYCRYISRYEYKKHRR